jgi:hypothetical protein
MDRPVWLRLRTKRQRLRCETCLALLRARLAIAESRLLLDAADRLVRNVTPPDACAR